jgi:LemA protein
MNLILIIIAVIILLIIVYFIYAYNGLISARNLVKNSWAQIEVQLKRRTDLIPNLIETVKGYASHEKTVFEEVTQARTQLMNANTVEDTEKANNQLNGALKSLFAVAENYPELKANSNFQQLQDELTETEDKIAYSRQFYNDTVLMYNNKCQMFPSNLIANMFNFQEEKFFQAPEGETSVPKVEF